MVTIRLATTQDYPAIGDITWNAYVTAGHIAPDGAYAQSLADISSRTEGLTVAELDGRVVGSVNIAAPGSPMAEVAYDNELEFRMLAVAPDVQSRGIGSALVQHVLDTARTQHLAGVAITTMASMTTAQAMYHAMGFQRAPARDWSLYTAGKVEHQEGTETFLVYVHPLKLQKPSEGDSWLTR